MNLTPSQISAIHTDASECLVLAGAGSGKTRVLVERIAHLLKQGATPAELLVLTFTRKAANEMRQRLIALLGGDDATATIVRDIQISTFHAFALRVLQLYGDLLGYDPASLTVIDPEDSDMLLKQVATDLGFFRSGKWKNGLSEKKVQRWREDRYCGRDSSFDNVGQMCHRDDILTEYQTRLHLWNLCDFGQLLLQCRRLFREHPGVLSNYHARFKHVLVDEGQDSSAIEFSLYEVLCPPATLFIVGDFRQSVYAFRGARPDFLRSFVMERGFVEAV